MSLRSPAENENTSFVMPAWIAGIQFRKDASGDIPVNLDSSTPCWNDAMRGFTENERRSSNPHFKRDPGRNFSLARFGRGQG
jgi:hypothetical protein